MATGDAGRRPGGGGVRGTRCGTPPRVHQRTLCATERAAWEHLGYDPDTVAQLWGKDYTDLGIRIDELVKRRATVNVDYRGEKLKVDYYPDRFTPAMEREARARQDNEETASFGAMQIVDMLLPLLADWDLYLEGDVKVPLTPDGMSNIPINLLLEILRQVTEDMRPGEEKSEHSRSGSLRKV